MFFKRTQKTDQSRVSFHLWTGSRYISVDAKVEALDLASAADVIRELGLQVQVEQCHVHVTDDQGEHLLTFPAHEVERCLRTSGQCSSTT